MPARNDGFRTSDSGEGDTNYEQAAPAQEGKDSKVPHGNTWCRVTGVSYKTFGVYTFRERSMHRTASLPNAEPVPRNDISTRLYG